ncbi:septum site-determining protein MinC [Gallionella capsiferriformans]|jgi:septum site-determining protein MinC|uniref:Probable septum site-determining protein MinC n=1 Tax=Gallionella capsiferriformans (strain ES-2) TaxID=395494 RepID=D9SEY7_GALCS|nr:septum site-determining protein MinC [Gallionella capsiferriformans]ADL55084.1 septum site-determining protein MinC [Gallionella capsiferriformans ES-2]
MREEPVFKIKTGNLSVLQLHILTTNLSDLKRELSVRLAQTPDFFVSTPIVLELSGIAELEQGLDFVNLVSFMQSHGMCAAGIVGGSVGQREDAIQAGLGIFPDVVVRNPMRRATDDPFSVTGVYVAATPAPVASPLQPELPGFEPTLEAVSEVSTASVKPMPTMVIDKPVRTGQRIYAEGANLVVLAIVNAGAELIADGDIHVYAPMRGKAIAGAQGNEAARIFVNSMEAELLSIAGCFKVFEDGVPENVSAKPARVHLDGSRLVIQPLNY